MELETLAIHAGQTPDPTTGAIMTPVYLTSTYAQDGPGGHKGYEYSRTDNPTRSVLQAALAALEGANPGKNIYPARVIGPSRSSEGLRLYYLVCWLDEEA